MGKVYVIRKELPNAGLALTPGTGSGAQVMLSPGSGNRPNAASFGPAQFDDKGEQISGTGEYGPQGSYENRLAQFGDKYGHLARYGMAGLGALNSFYNTTSSGQPGALGAAASGAYTGWLGSGGAERGAANLGSRFGARLDRRNTTGAQEDENTTVPTIASSKQISPTNAAMQSLRRESEDQNWFNDNNNYHPMSALRQEYS